MRRRGSRGAWASVLAAALVAGCGAGREASEAPDREVAVHVRAAALVERSFADQVSAPGSWRAANEVVISAPFAAVVESLGPRVGDAVRAGQAIGLLVTRESRATLRGAELMLHQAGDPASRAEAEKALEQARHELVRVPLVAAASGTVTRRAAEPGAELVESAEILALVPLHELVFEAHVPSVAATSVRPGQSARIVGEDGESFTATVQRRMPAVSAEEQSVLFWLAPRGAPPPGAIGRFGTAAITVGAARMSVAIPDSALVEDDLTAEFRVARIDAHGVALWTQVRIGRASDGWHELLSPALVPGTQVVIAGQRGLPDSVRVTLR